MDITFKEYDDILKRYEKKEISFEHIDLSKIEHVERILKMKHGIEFLICLLERGDFKTPKELELKKEINKLLIKELNFVD